MNLQLSLKTNWFQMTKSEIKTEDYREITPYWCNRFLLQNGKKQSSQWWSKYLHHYYKRELAKLIKEKDDLHKLSFVKFQTNIMTLGYPQSTDLERVLKLQHKGIKIRTGNSDWGAEPNILYFVILHGSLVK